MILTTEEMSYSALQGGWVEYNVVPTKAKYPLAQRWQISRNQFLEAPA